nr:uncharacterized protein LOC128687890 isoform X3 [Cherax quadricarinatus]
MTGLMEARTQLRWLSHTKWAVGRTAYQNHQDAEQPLGQLKMFGEMRTGCLVKVNEQEVALFRFGNVVYAISEHCPHSGGPLHIGDIESLPDQSLCVRCPYHGWKFNLVTGRCHHPKTRQDLSAMVFPVKVNPQNGELDIGFSEFNPFYFTTPLA